MSSPFLGCFWSILFILANDEDMHKISNEFEFRPDRTTDYRVSYTWGLKKFLTDLQWENGVSVLAHSLLIESSSKLLVTRTCIKARMSSILGLWFPWPIYMFFWNEIWPWHIGLRWGIVALWATCICIWIAVLYCMRSFPKTCLTGAFGGYSLFRVGMDLHCSLKKCIHLYVIRPFLI